MVPMNRAAGSTSTRSYPGTSMARRKSSVACSTAKASFLAMLISSRMPKPPFLAHRYTGPGRKVTCPPTKVSMPMRLAASMFTWNDTSQAGRPKAMARFSASTFLPVALLPASSRFSPHSRAAAAASHTSFP